MLLHHIRRLFDLPSSWSSGLISANSVRNSYTFRINHSYQSSTALSSPGNTRLRGFGTFTADPCSILHNYLGPVTTAPRPQFLKICADSREHVLHDTLIPPAARPLPIRTVPVISQPTSPHLTTSAPRSVKLTPVQGTVSDAGPEPRDQYLRCQNP